MSDEPQECVVCNEECQEQTACGHIVHTQCIARSGKSECPMCRQAVTISSDHLEVYNEAVIRNRRLEEERNREAAQEIQEQEVPRQNRRPQGPPLIYVGGRELRWIRVDPPEMNIDQLFIELATINQAREGQEVQCSARVLRILNLVYEARELSIEANINLRQLFDTILTVFEE